MRSGVYVGSCAFKISDSRLVEWNGSVWLWVVVELLVYLVETEQ